MEISDSLLDQKKDFVIIQDGILTQCTIFLSVCKIISCHSRQTAVTELCAQAAAFNTTDFCSQRWKLNTQITVIGITLILQLNVRVLHASALLWFQIVIKSHN